ncbi:LON peptidase substrate-binding domain-containing protein [Breoghania sp. L-A4]|uniref:LON peptidase substrate-binding domain-containing protein n=1 Tax=Breoghania sp. L-A4 TaxID=2304600 RepID=UPI000E35809F|nr:LON peptidase substrate-binding domain-containing protein [Breoghania sp. L-A4]AXS38797.1 hypothetical protein D1F64_00395 [Breoghania sp. L-A4]
MYAGNKSYEGLADLPSSLMVFPLPGVLLLPRGELPLNIFEPRYLNMVDAALRGDRMIGMVQPRFDVGDVDLAGNPPLCSVGCAGRITGFMESGDGRYRITLTGVARFRIGDELDGRKGYRICRISAGEFVHDLLEAEGEDAVDRAGLLRALRAYLKANNMETDWESISNASTEILVNALSMMSPYGPAEKQALLEAEDLKARADTLIAITEMELARGGGSSTLQ